MTSAEVAKVNAGLHAAGNAVAQGASLVGGALLQIPANVSTLFRLKVSSPFRFKLSSGIFIKNKELHQAILVNSKINISPLLFS